MAWFHFEPILLIDRNDTAKVSRDVPVVITRVEGGAPVQVHDLNHQPINLASGSNGFTPFFALQDVPNARAVAGDLTQGVTSLEARDAGLQATAAQQAADLAAVSAQAAASAAAAAQMAAQTSAAAAAATTEPSAYDLAVAGGYTGTEQQFSTALATVGTGTGTAVVVDNGNGTFSASKNDGSTVVAYDKARADQLLATKLSSAVAADTYALKTDAFTPTNRPGIDDVLALADALAAKAPAVSGLVQRCLYNGTAYVIAGTTIVATAANRPVGYLRTWVTSGGGPDPQAAGLTVIGDDVFDVV